MHQGQPAFVGNSSQGQSVTRRIRGINNHLDIGKQGSLRLIRHSNLMSRNPYGRIDPPASSASNWGKNPHTVFVFQGRIQGGANPIEKHQLNILFRNT